MNLSAIIGVAIGLAFMYLLLSMICSTLQEWGAAITKRRASYLRKGLAALLNDRAGTALPVDPPAVTQLLKHPLIESLMTRSLSGAKPQASSLSYLPSRNFVIALLETFAADTLKPGADIEAALQKLEVTDAKTGILQEQTDALKKSLIGLARRANNDREAFLKGTEQWYDDTMDRVSGWYKRHTQVVVIVIAVLVTLSLNVDTVKVGKKLYSDAGLRAAVSAAAEAYVATHERPTTAGTSATVATVTTGNVAATDSAATATATTDTAATDTAATDTAATDTAATDTAATGTAETTVPTDAELKKKMNDQVAELNSLNLPIGWRWQTPEDAKKADAAKGLPTSLGGAICEAVSRPGTWFGWFLTIVALSLGAPFWFDILMKVVNIRTNGPKPERSADTPAK
jgi:hypothetical protein